jgi:transglutaminase-like putative cysteine protease
VDVHLTPDPDRALPEFPDSPWSRELGVEGDAEHGWTVHVELRAYDHPEATTTIPVPPAGFERDLESTVLMPLDDPKVRKAVHDAIGDEKDARRAAEKIARWVYLTLDKHSPAVAEASAPEILEGGCGDCSEHALLFVTLCRAAGIPARLCSGYVTLGTVWGGHDWAEIWLGRWVSADPTTGEVGGGARYLFFGYPDRPDSHPGEVSGRAAGRMRFVTTHVEEGGDAYDVGGPETWVRNDDEARRYVHVLAGLEARDVPPLWVVRMAETNRAEFRAEGVRAQLFARADQGQRLEQVGEPNATFAGVPAIRQVADDGVLYVVHSRRRFLWLRVQAEDVAPAVDALEKMLAPTFAPRPGPPPAAPAKGKGEAETDPAPAGAGR